MASREQRREKLKAILKTPQDVSQFRDDNHGRGFRLRRRRNERWTDEEHVTRNIELILDDASKDQKAADLLDKIFNLPTDVEEARLAGIRAIRIPFWAFIVAILSLAVAVIALIWKAKE